MHRTVSSTVAEITQSWLSTTSLERRASPEDVDSIGTNAGGTTLTHFPDVTPTVAPGIAFAAENTGLGPSTAVGTGFIWDNILYGRDRRRPVEQRRWLAALLL